MKSKKQIEQAIEKVRRKMESTDNLYHATLRAYQEGQIDGLKWALEEETWAVEASESNNYVTAETTKPDEEQVRECLRMIVEHRNEKSLNWAVNYAAAGISMSGDALRVQCLYVLNNMTRWRGEIAKQVRSTLKRFAGVE